LKRGKREAKVMLEMIINGVVFYLFAILSVIAAVFTISFVNPVKSAISMIFCLFCIACVYFTLSAAFVGIVQILVYAGAIMVLFLFVVLLLEKRDYENSTEDNINAAKIVSVLTAASLFTALTIAIGANGSAAFPPASDGFGSIKVLGSAIFQKYLFAFEALSVLILVAIAGVTLLASKKTAGDK